MLSIHVLADNHEVSYTAVAVVYLRVAMITE